VFAGREIFSPARSLSHTPSYPERKHKITLTIVKNRDLRSHAWAPLEEKQNTLGFSKQTRLLRFVLLPYHEL
jgi:hypothetical protein